MVTIDPVSQRISMSLEVVAAEVPAVG